MPDQADLVNELGFALMLVCVCLRHPGFQSSFRAPICLFPFQWAWAPVSMIINASGE